MFVCSPCQPAAAVTFQTRRKTKENYFEQNVWYATLRTVRCVHSFLYDPSENLCGLKLFLNICFKCCDIWQAMPKLINKITFTQTEIKHIFSTFHFFCERTTTIQHNILHIRLCCTTHRKFAITQKKFKI